MKRSRCLRRLPALRGIRGIVAKHKHDRDRATTSAQPPPTPPADAAPRETTREPKHLAPAHASPRVGPRALYALESFMESFHQTRA